ncbi:MAG: hypothetical protein KatS3mg115_0938 [Candidatus Poribacteria bacterium]|nr:MAG: hypothetical protein KatS3mg115_0938 [Candidatus Poribacteria bacterium]
MGGCWPFRRTTGVGVRVVELTSGRTVPLSELSWANWAALDLSLPSLLLPELPALREGFVFADRRLSGELVRILPDDRKEWARSWVISEGMRTCDAVPPVIEGAYRDRWHTLPEVAFAYSRPLKLWALALSSAEGAPEALLRHPALGCPELLERRSVGRSPANLCWATGRAASAGTLAPL